MIHAHLQCNLWFADQKGYFIWFMGIHDRLRQFRNTEAKKVCCTLTSTLGHPSQYSVAILIVETLTFLALRSSSVLSSSSWLGSRCRFWVRRAGHSLSSLPWSSCCCRCVICLWDCPMLLLWSTCRFATGRCVLCLWDWTAGTLSSSYSCGCDCCRARVDGSWSLGSSGLSSGTGTHHVLITNTTS